MFFKQEPTVHLKKAKKPGKLWCADTLPELQIREGIEDNSKIIFLISAHKTYVVTPL